MTDFRSDTVTKPTKEMRAAMLNAEVGDDVLQEDPTVNKLEHLAAKKLEKEAALFVPSGTFGNQLAILTHTKRGDEIIVKDDTHVVQHEVGASAVIAGVQLRTVNVEKSYMVWDDISKYIRSGYDIHQPETGMLELQNSLGNGDVMPLEDMKLIYNNLKDLDIPVHLDGARIFNAAEYLKVEAAEIAQYCDSVMFCLSKGLGAPVGSMLVGTKDFIFKARKNRKLMGGGMRQVGILAAPGIIALEEMTKRLHIDYSNAKRIAKEFAEYDIFDINPDEIKTNIFFLKFSTKDKSVLQKFYNLLIENGILVYPPRNGGIRFVLHYDVKECDIDKFIKLLPSLVKQMGKLSTS
ncbi:MAG: low specificity L-threonine aldolase [Bacteroidales bacterium]|nr:low specificity L-threonine aldolase [Bacteroidales bacterium]